MNTRYRLSRWLLGPVFLVLAALACDSVPPPLTGITCLQQQDDGSILAVEQDSSYVSRNGGTTWEQNRPLAPDPLKGCNKDYSTRALWVLADPRNPSIVYRFKPELSIDRPEDGGVTWQRDIDLSGTEARTSYYVTMRHDGNEERSGPLDALIDPHTGNLVVAMGYEGVLVRTPQAHWWWVTVGKYSRVDMRDMSITLPLISGDLWLAALIGIVLAASLPTLARGTNFWWVAGAATLSGLAVIAGLFIYIYLVGTFRVPIEPGLYDFPVVRGTIVVIGLAIPGFISWKFAAKSSDVSKVAFIWSAICWTYLGIILTLFIMFAIRS